MLRVLMIEDSPGDALRLRSGLATGAVELTAVRTLAGALAAVAGEPFDCALLGLPLPDARGLGKPVILK